MNTYSILLISLIALISPFASAQELPALVAKVYPGAVPEHTKNGKPATCGDNEEAYCFLTRDPVDKVSAFYAQQGIKLETLPADELAGIGGWMSNFEQSLRVDLESKPSALRVAPLEFYQTKGADDEPSYFNALVIMSKAKSTPIQADEKGTQAIIENSILGDFAVSSISGPISKMIATLPTYGKTRMEPALLVPHYNRHLSMWSGFFSIVDSQSAATMLFAQLDPVGAKAAMLGGSKSDVKEEEVRDELNKILARKPEIKARYQSLRRSAHGKEERKKIQPQLDKILMSDPELASWKKRSDALEQQGKEGDTKQSNSKLTSDEVEAYLQALEKEVYYTRILIHMSEGRRVTRDAATLRREWTY